MGDRIEWVSLDGPTRRRLEDALEAVLRRRSWVSAAYLHGSLSEPGGLGRDVDIGLAVHELPVDPDELDRISRELEELTGIDERLLDIRILDGSNPVLLGEVLSRGRCLWESSRDERVLFEARSLSIWLDFKPVWERMRREMLERWSRG